METKNPPLDNTCRNHLAPIRDISPVVRQHRLGKLLDPIDLSVAKGEKSLPTAFDTLHQPPKPCVLYFKAVGLIDRIPLCAKRPIKSVQPRQKRRVLILGKTPQTALVSRRIKRARLVRKIKFDRQRVAKTSHRIKQIPERMSLFRPAMQTLGIFTVNASVRALGVETQNRKEAIVV